jgi:hypothetical protein
MVQASLPDSVSDQASASKVECGALVRPFARLDICYHRMIKNREGYLLNISQGDAQRRVLKMAEHTEPAATQVAGITGMAIYNCLPVVAYKGPALSAA